LATLMHVEVLILRLLRVAILKTEEPAAATDGCSERREMEMKGLFLSRVSVRGGDCEPGKGGLPQGQGCFSDEASRRRRRQAARLPVRGTAGPALEAKMGGEAVCWASPVEQRNTAQWCPVDATRRLQLWCQSMLNTCFLTYSVHK
jgi:hypothetical protein